MTKNQVYNPYLPLDVYIPDGEPHVFNDRLYVFGSHDKEGGKKYCEENYTFYSAPVDDLSDWTYHGISYDKALDPDYDPDGKYRDLYAPDVVEGNDGRYYLYYALAGGAFTGPIHVAVADKPEGPYAYHGCVRNADGSDYQRNITFDPGVINDDGVIRLYYGWAIGAPQMANMGKFKRALIKPTLKMVERRMFDKTKEQIKAEPQGIQGAFTVVLADDMLTVKSEPVKILPGQFDAEFQGHAFFEASSIRKIGDKYYYIYSSEVNHELCYAISDYPDHDFHYGGVIISNGDIGYNGRTAKDRLAMTGNNHGSIVRVKDQWYIFYHRHTHGTPYSRQGCAEKIAIKEDGSIPQVEMTSCGLNDGLLKAQGEYPAAIACNLTNGKMPHIGLSIQRISCPFITDDGRNRYITQIDEGTLIAYKYFDFKGTCDLIIDYKADEEGYFDVCLDDEQVGKITCEKCEHWSKSSVAISHTGTAALKLVYHSKGKADLLKLNFR